MTVDKLQAQYEAAVTTRDQALDGLKRDGQPLYVPDEEQRRKVEIDETHRAALASLKAELASTVAAAQEQVSASGAHDPLSRLSDSDLARAAHRREFLKED